jgi:hypothetical protein
MRTAKVLALGLMLTMASAGCSRPSTDGDGVATAQTGAAGPSAGPSTAAGRDPDAPLKFAKCMRENGMTWFPDPKAGGGPIRMPENMDMKKFEAANKACEQYSPGADGDGKIDPAMLESMRQMSKCMRENGVPNFPDPNPNGNMVVDGGKLGMGPGDPTFDKAQEKCAKFMPRPEGGTGPQTNSNGLGEATS